MAKASAFLYRDFNGYDEKAATKNLTLSNQKVLEEVSIRLADLGDWNRTANNEAVILTAEALNVKLGNVAQPLRVAVSGTSVSPPIDVTLELLGRDKTLERIDQAIDFIVRKSTEADQSQG